MAYHPGDDFVEVIVTSNAAGQAIDATWLPTVVLMRNGTDDPGVTVTVTNIDTGRYKATGTIPATYLAGDVLHLSGTANVDGVSPVKFALALGVLEPRLGVLATVEDAAPTPSTFTAAAGLSAVDGFYNGSVVVPLSGALQGIPRKVTGYDGATRAITVSPAFPAAIADGVPFMFLGRIE